MSPRPLPPAKQDRWTSSAAAHAAQVAYEFDSDFRDRSMNPC